jgi:hypothetical protein
LYLLLVGNPQPFSNSYAVDCFSNETPEAAPMPWTTTSRGLDAVIFGSFWRREPAAAFLGLANLGLPDSANESFNSSKALRKPHL